MLLRAIGMLAFLGSIVSEVPTHAQNLAPCRTVEPAPGLSESNPTTRHAVVTHGDGTGNDREVTAETCLVVGINDMIRPGGNFFKPDGLYFNWNLALVGDNGRIVDVAGTVSRTGDIQAGSPDTLALPLVLGWNLSPDEPNPLTNRLFTQVAVWPCTVASPGCTPDQSQQVELTHLLGSPDRSSYVGAPVPANEPTGCLAPMKQGGPDPELRQVTVIGFANQYLIFTCLVSDKFDSFKSAGFEVTPLDAQKNALAFIGGNTRENIRKLVAPPWSKAPQLITLLAVQVQSRAPITTPVAQADITYTYTGCKSLKCLQQVSVHATFPAEFHQK